MRNQVQMLRGDGSLKGADGIRRRAAAGALSIAVCACALLPLGAGRTAFGATPGGIVRQSVPLKAGWNLVWLAVEPAPNEPGAVMGALDYESVWSFVPGVGDNERGAWVGYQKGKPEFVNTLKELQGGRGYLVRMLSAGTLQVSGRPLERPRRFSGGRSTLFGLNLPSGTPGPTFNDHFRFEDANQSILSIYKLLPSGFAPVSPLSAIESGVSYWITFSRDLAYDGPFRINAPAQGYQFGARGYRLVISAEVPSRGTEQVLTVKARPSDPPPPGQPADAGSGNASWIEYLSVQAATATTPAKREWKPLSGGANLVIPAQATRGELDIRCVRAGRAPAGVEETNSLYQAVLEIRDGAGNVLQVGAGMEVTPFNGLYIGQARLKRVSRGSGDTAPAPNPPEMAPMPPLTMALILSLPPEAEGGSPKLLDQKTLATMRDGRLLKMRYNAVLFDRSVELTGQVTANGAGGTLTGTLHTPADDPLNPYRHRYHPEHTVGYAITREITLEFSATDPDPVNQAMGLAETSGSNELTGSYTEVIKGLTQDPVVVSGPFKLTRMTRSTNWEPAASAE